MSVRSVSQFINIYYKLQAKTDAIIDAVYIWRLCSIQLFSHNNNNVVALLSQCIGVFMYQCGLNIFAVTVHRHWLTGTQWIRQFLQMSKWMRMGVRGGLEPPWNKSF